MHSGLHSSQTGDTPHQTVVCYKWCWHVCLCLCVSACVHNHTRVCVTVCTAAACLHSMRRRWSGFRSEGCEVAWWKLAHGGGEKSPDLPSSPQSSKDWTSNPPGLSQMFNSDEKGKRTLVSCQENLLGFHPRCCHRKGSRFFFPPVFSLLLPTQLPDRGHIHFSGQPIRFCHAPHQSHCQIPAVRCHFSPPPWNLPLSSFWSRTPHPICTNQQNSLSTLSHLITWLPKWDCNVTMGYNYHSIFTYLFNFSCCEHYFI